MCAWGHLFHVFYSMVNIYWVSHIVSFNSTLLFANTSHVTLFLSAQFNNSSWFIVPFLDGNRSGFGLPHCLWCGKLECITTIIIIRPSSGHILNQVCISQEFLPFSGSLQIWWGLEKKQNAYFPALLAPASVSSSPQAGLHLISGMIKFFWGYFGAHKKNAEIMDCLEIPEALRKITGSDLYFKTGLCSHNQTFL